ncbi:MAG TPA: flagellar export protein FliJ [Clostridiales bacterium]|nr:flagellar export protein FliJ [Clostridiales bacterium]
MKKFRYSMESVLQIKLKLENQAKIAYSNARMKLTKEEEKLEQLKHRRLSLEEELRRLSTGRLDLFQIQQCEQAVQFTDARIKQQETVVRNAAHRLEVARIRLSDAMIGRKTQERLKEKAFEEYIQEFDAEERKEVDELNSFSYNSPALSGEDG